MITRRNTANNKMRTNQLTPTCLNCSKCTMIGNSTERPCFDYISNLFIILHRVHMCSLTASPGKKKLSEKFESIFATVGFHPHESKNATNNYLDTIRSLLETPKVVAVGEIGIELGLIDKMAEVNPIKSIYYPTPAKRPTFSVLDNDLTQKFLSLKSIHWRKSMLNFLKLVDKNKI